MVVYKTYQQYRSINCIGISFDSLELALYRKMFAIRMKVWVLFHFVYCQFFVRRAIHFRNAMNFI
jgi:hypothetical protein